MIKRQVIRISILQSSKIMTALYAVTGILYSLIGLPMIMVGTGQMRVLGFVYLLGPLWMGIVGFVFFVIGSALYNVLAKSLGGFEVEVRNVS